MKRLIITLLPPILTISIECRADNLQLSSRQVSTGHGLPGNTINGLLVQAPDLNSSSKPLNDQSSKRLITSQADKVFLTKLEMLTAQHLSDSSFNIDQLAAVMNMGRTKFFGKVKDMTGLSPNK
jgi:hypothetical protein